MRNRLIPFLSFILAACSLLCYLIYTVIKNNKIKNEILQKLYDMKDSETLYKIGEINAHGEKERRRVVFFVVADYLDDKYAKTKNEIYNDLKNIFMEGACKILGYWFLFGILVIVAFAIYNWPRN
jgi:hypothetical protein